MVLNRVEAQKRFRDSLCMRDVQQGNSALNLSAQRYCILDHGKRRFINVGGTRKCRTIVILIYLSRGVKVNGFAEPF